MTAGDDDHYRVSATDHMVLRKLLDTLSPLAELRQTIENIDEPVERAAKARDAVVGMLNFVQSFLGHDVMRAAYGEIDPSDREESLRVVALRVLTVSALFARMPDDAGSLGHIANEAIAVARGDAPVFFAQIAGARKRSWRVTKARFGAYTWDAYLEGLGVEAVIRQSAIAVAFGFGWDTVRKWIKPARSLLGDGYVNYHLRKAKVEGMRGQPYSFSESYHSRRSAAPVTWQDALTRDGERFRAVQRASKAA